MPNVSLCVQENEVHYNPYFGPYAGHEFVDLGLPSGTKWATMNIGASSETDYGLFFQWGDTQGYTASEVGSGEGQKYFGWEDYKYGNGTSSPTSTSMTKYNSTDGKTVLLAEDDAVQAAWGGSWRMPTNTEFNELLSTANCTKQWVTNYDNTGINGYLFTSVRNSNTLFFPAAGSCDKGSVRGIGTYAYYWSSSLRPDEYVSYSRYFSFSSSGCNLNNTYRYVGCFVRGVVVQA